MSVGEFKRRLLDLEVRLSDGIARARDNARAQATDEGRDAGDASLADEAKSEELGKAEPDATVLQQVWDALLRIDDGTFGLCIVDGAPIDKKRLEAIPWTPYCLKHQMELERTSRPAPTL